MSEYPRAEKIVEDFFKDKILATGMVICQMTDNAFLVHSGGFGIPFKSKMGSLEVIIDRENYYMPIVGDVLGKDVPELFDIFKDDFYLTYKEIKDKKLIEKIKQLL